MSDTITADQVADLMVTARRTHSMRSARSQQSAEGQIGASDLGYCRSYLKLMLAGVPDDEQDVPDDKLAAFVGSAYGDRIEEAYKSLHPNALTQVSLTATFPSGRQVPCNLDIIDTDLNILIDGKGLALDTAIPTPSGWTTMGALEVGDAVFDMNGAATKVSFKSEVKNLRCYRVTFATGESVVCDEEHLWWRTVRGGGNALKVSNVRNLRAGDRIPVTGALGTIPTYLPLDPWFVGYWLGNGSAQSLYTLHSHSDDADFVVNMVRASGLAAVSVSVKGNSSRINVSRGVQEVPLQTLWRDLGFEDGKSIPPTYLRASHDDRLALLRGLMDSDGSWNKRRKRATFVSTSERLATQVAELARSLGQRVQFNQRQARGFGLEVTAYTVEWSATINPFWLPRKAEQVVISDVQRARAAYHHVKSVEEVESVPTQCIAVASPTESYLCGDLMVPTHNTKAGLALVRADKEPDRQHRYQVATYLMGAIQNGYLKKGARAFLVYADRSGKDPRDYAVEVVVTDDLIAEIDEFVDDAIYAFVHNVEAPKDRQYNFCESYCSKFRSCRERDTLEEGIVQSEEAALALKVHLEAKETIKEATARKKEADDELRKHSGVILSDDGAYEISKTIIGAATIPESYRRESERLNVRKKR